MQVISDGVEIDTQISKAATPIHNLIVRQSKPLFVNSTVRTEVSHGFMYYLRHLDHLVNSRNVYPIHALQEFTGYMWNPMWMRVKSCSEKMSNGKLWIS